MEDNTNEKRFKHEGWPTINRTSWKFENYVAVLEEMVCTQREPGKHGMTLVV